MGLADQDRQRNVIGLLSPRAGMKMPSRSEERRGAESNLSSGGAVLMPLLFPLHEFPLDYSATA